MSSIRNVTKLSSSLAARSPTLGSRPFSTRFRSVGTSKAPPLPIQPRFETTAQDHIERHAHTFPPAIRETKQPSLPSHSANTIDLQNRVTAWMDNTSKSIAWPSAEAVNKSASIVHPPVTRSVSGSSQDAPSDALSCSNASLLRRFTVAWRRAEALNLPIAQELIRKYNPNVHSTASSSAPDDTRSTAASGVVGDLRRLQAALSLVEGSRQPSPAVESSSFASDYTRSTAASGVDLFGVDLQGLQAALNDFASAKAGQPLVEESRQPSPALESNSFASEYTRSATDTGGELFGVDLRGLQVALNSLAGAKAGQPVVQGPRQPSPAADSYLFPWDVTHSIHGYTGISTAELDRQFFAKAALCQAAPGLTELNQRAAANRLQSQAKAAHIRSSDSVASWLRDPYYGDSEISRVSTTQLVNRRRPTPNSQFPDDCTPSWIRDEIDERLAARQAAAEQQQDRSITKSATPSFTGPLIIEHAAEDLPLHAPTPRPPPRVIRIPSNPSVKACRTLTLPSEPGFERPISPPRAPDTSRIWSWLRSFSHPEEDRFARRVQATQNTRSTFVGTLFNRFEQFASGACKNAYALYRDWRAKLPDSVPGWTVTPSQSTEPQLQPVAFPKAAPRKISLFDSLKDVVMKTRPPQPEPRTRRSTRFYNPRFCPPHQEFREI